MKYADMTREQLEAELHGYTGLALDGLGSVLYLTAALGYLAQWPGPYTAATAAEMQKYANDAMRDFAEREAEKIKDRDGAS